jgi:opacity protein-like surface antigen
MGQEIIYARYSRNGYSIAVNTFVEYDFLKSLRHQLFISPAIGLAYASETYFTIPDYPLISSPVNVSFKVEFGYRYTLSPNWKVSTAYMISHFSNGNTSTPNFGLNMQAWT